MPTSQRNTPADQALEAIDASRTVAEFERAFLHAAPRLIDADGYGICWLDSSGRRTASVRALNVPPGLVDDYEALGRDNDALFGHMIQRHEPVHDRVLFDRSAWRRNPLSHMLSGWGFERCLQAPVTVDGVLRSTLHFIRAPGARPFADRDLRAAVALHRRVEHQLRCILAERELERTRRMCASLLEHIPVPAAITTARAELVHVNHAADLMLVTYRAEPALWPEYAVAVRTNVAAIGAKGANDDGARAARRDCEDPGYLVRTSPVEDGDRFLSLFHPAREERAGASSLAPREQVIANLVAQGYTNDRIASALNLSVNTVKVYLKRINRKLGTANRAQVAAWAQDKLAEAARAEPFADS